MSQFGYTFIPQRAPQLVFVGGGPKTTGLLLALAAGARADRGAYPERLGIHVIDPFPAGAGRIWRTDQEQVLWMNSLAEDVTIFADDTLDPAPVPGPSLDEWAQQRGAGVAGPAVRAGEFAPRALQGDYLADAFESAVRALPDGFEVTVHRGRATAVRSAGPGADHTCVTVDEGGQRIELCADVLVLAQGFVEVDPDEVTRQLQERARREGLVYVAPGYTADIDLSVLPAGEDVLVRGMGLAFIDAMMMLTAGRGGQFSRDAAGTLSYQPSGAEPVLWAGSRRGVPYKSKLGYRPEGMKLGPPRYIDRELLEALRGPDGYVSIAHSVLPVLESEMAAAHYAELAYRHPERIAAGVTGATFTELADARVAALAAGDDAAAVRAATALRELAVRVIPDPADRFDLAALDRPLDGLHTADAAGFEDVVAGHVAAEVARAADPRYSQDSAVFHALVSAYFALREYVADGFFSAAERIREFDGRLHGLFSYIASGPPPERLEALLALHRAGIVHFAGPDMQVRLENGEFTARSSGHPEVLHAQALLDARLAPVSAAQAADPLLRQLIESGELLLEAGAGQAAKFVATADSRAVSGDGSVHPALFLVGPSVAGSVGEAFARPGTNSRVFRDNQRLAEEIRGQLRAAPHAGETTRLHPVHRPTAAVCAAHW